MLSTLLYQFVSLIVREVVFQLLGLRRILQITLLVKHSVCRAENDEFGSSVQLVAYFLLVFAQLFDELFSQDVAFFQPVVFGSHFLADGLRLFFAVSNR